jgi:hypothetical protein
MSTDITLDIRGQKVPVGVSSHGIFSAGIAGKNYSSATLDGLRASLLEASRKAAARVAVPFTATAYGDRLWDGTATGIHATTGKVLYRDSRGKNGQLEPYNTVYRPLTEQEKAEYAGLNAALREAQEAMNDWRETRSFRVGTAVQEAVEAASRELAAREG